MEPTYTSTVVEQCGSLDYGGRWSFFWFPCTHFNLWSFKLFLQQSGEEEKKKRRETIDHRRQHPSFFNDHLLWQKLIHIAHHTPHNMQYVTSNWIYVHSALLSEYVNMCRRNYNSELEYIGSTKTNTEHTTRRFGCVKEKERVKLYWMISEVNISLILFVFEQKKKSFIAVYTGIQRTTLNAEDSNISYMPDDWHSNL